MKALLALDVFGESEQAIAHAVPWAARLGATLDLATATEIISRSRDFFSDTEFATLSLGNEERVAALERLVGNQLLEIPEPMRGEAHLIRGGAAPALIAFADRYDVLILATHGRRGLSRLFAGSVAEAVVRAVQCPVLVTRTDGQAVSPAGSLKIALPIDCEEPDPAGIRAALALLGRDHDYHAVYTMPDIAALGDPYATASGHKLGTLSAEAGLEGVPRVVRTHRGNAGDDIAAYAREIGADLIALPTHSRTAIGRLAFGSVAERVVRVAPCAVLVTRQ